MLVKTLETATGGFSTAFAWVRALQMGLLWADLHGCDDVWCIMQTLVFLPFLAVFQMCGFVLHLLFQDFLTIAIHQIIEDLRLHVWSSVSKHHASRKLCLLSKPPMTNKESQWTVAACCSGLRWNSKTCMASVRDLRLSKENDYWLHDTWYDITWIIIISEGAPNNKSRWQENIRNHLRGLRKLLGHDLNSIQWLVGAKDLKLKLADTNFTCWKNRTWTWRTGEPNWLVDLISPWSGKRGLIIPNLHGLGHIGTINPVLAASQSSSKEIVSTQRCDWHAFL